MLADHIEASESDLNLQDWISNYVSSRLSSLAIVHLPEWSNKMGHYNITQNYEEKKSQEKTFFSSNLNLNQKDFENYLRNELAKSENSGKTLTFSNSERFRLFS